MTQINAKIILDSINERGNRLTTFECTYPRLIHSELMTHRVFSRNAASSRAIPVEKLFSRYLEDPALPVSYPAEQPGMQGGTELSGEALTDALTLIDSIRDATGATVQAYLDAHPDKPTRLHKSVLNRYLEPFGWMTTIITSVDYENFFKQRCSPLAQPEIHVLANMMREAYRLSNPTLLVERDWHLPYIQEEEYYEYDMETLKKLSAARCARVSYLTHDGRRDIADDIKLFERLASADPGHWSPLEHVATPYLPGRIKSLLGVNAKGNLPGWKQMRHDFEKAA